MSLKQVRVVAALIADPGQQRYLVQQRRPGQSRANLWEFPGGKVEAGETDQAALARECREELDVELQVGRRLHETTHAYPDLVVTLALYAAELARGVPRALGAQAIAYCTLAQMRRLPFCEADLPLLQALEEGEP